MDRLIEYALACECDADVLVFLYGFAEDDGHVQTLKGMAKEFRTRAALELSREPRDTIVDDLFVLIDAAPLRTGT